MNYKIGDIVNGRELLSELSGTGNRGSYGVFKCPYCENSRRVRLDHVLSGASKSCGCVFKGKRKHFQTTFDGFRSRTYNSWKGMIKRCTDPNHHQYFRYGAKGVKVCERWMDFHLFIADLGERPEGKTLDRFPDNCGNYEPGNCRWATPMEQTRNLRWNRKVTYNGETKTLVEWCEIYDLNYHRVIHRLNRGLDAERAFFLPKNAGCLYDNRKKK